MISTSSSHSLWTSLIREQINGVEGADGENLKLTEPNFALTKSFLKSIFFKFPGCFQNKMSWLKAIQRHENVKTCLNTLNVDSLMKDFYYMTMSLTQKLLNQVLAVEIAVSKRSEFIWGELMTMTQDRSIILVRKQNQRRKRTRINWVIMAFHGGLHWCVYSFTEFLCYILFCWWMF